MANDRIVVSLDEEHVKRTAQCPPETAIVELVWNALDAGATVIRVNVTRNELSGIERIEIEDNGSGISNNKLEESFGYLGRSSKPVLLQNDRGKPLHGCLGEGRFKAYSLGNKVSWVTRVKSAQAFEITGNQANIKEFSIIPVPWPLSSDSGTLFTAHNGYGSKLQLAADETVAAHLLPTFAPKLLIDPEVEIWIGQYKLDPASNIEHDHREELSTEFEDSYVKTVIWKSGQVHELHWCDRNCASRRTEPLDLDISLPFSIFLASPLIEEAVQHNTLYTPELAGLLPLKNDALGRSKKYLESFSRRTIKKTIEKLKARKVYPYVGEADSPLEQLERNVFDACATTIIRSIPAIEGANKESQKLTMHLLRQSLETSPSALQHVLQNVLNLPPSELAELSQLLSQVTLSGLISMGKMVTDRLSFLYGLEQLVLDPTWRRHLLERRQLHKVLEPHAWLFGEQFAVGTSDSSLNEVLDYHVRLLNHGEDLVEPDAALGTEMRKIPDLVLGRQCVSGSGDELEHLVIELKRPSVKVGFDQKTQIERYASTVSRESRFDKNKTRWIFYVVSSDIDDALRPSLQQVNRPPGQYQVTDNYEIWVKTWGELIQAAKGRMSYLKTKLDFRSSGEDGLSYIRTQCPEIMQEIEEASRQ